MIRRPATIIALGEDEVKCHLRGVSLWKLSLELDSLCLGDQDQSQGFGDDPFDDSFYDDPYASTDSDGEFDHDPLLNSTPAPSCGKTSDGIEEAFSSMGPNTSLASLRFASLRWSRDFNEFSAGTASEISTILPAQRPFQWCEQALLKMSMTETSPKVENINFSPRDRRREGTCKQSPIQIESGNRVGNRISNSQISPSSPNTFQELTISNVNLRAHALDPAESEKPNLADMKPSSPINSDDVDWEFGTVQPAAVFEAS